MIGYNKEIEMKRWIVCFAILGLLFPSVVFAAGASTTAAVTRFEIDDVNRRTVVAVTFTADDGTAAVTSLTLNPYAANIEGWYLESVQTDPGATGPTNGAWDVDLTDAYGYVVTRTLVDDRSSTATQKVYFASSAPQIQGNWTFSVGDNAVLSATAVVYLTFVDSPPQGGSSSVADAALSTLVTSGGGGYIRQDSTATIAKETGGNLADVKTALTRPVLEGGLTELIDKDDAAIAAGTYSDSVGVALAGTYSGEVLQVCLYVSELAGGSVADATNSGNIFIFDADPSITAADTDMAAAAADHKLAIGYLPVLASDWKEDSNGGMVCVSTPVAFHAVGTLYFVWESAAGATSINSAAGDDEEMHLNFWYRRDS